MATVLVVEDDIDTRDLMCRYLGLAGHCAVAAANGWEALLAMDKHGVDLILLDMMMPGMDGRTFLRIHRESQHRETPVIVFSALDAATVRDRLGGLCVRDVITKAGDYPTKLLNLVSAYSQSSYQDHGQYGRN
jgi:CheY-like chemotaxis protein